MKNLTTRLCTICARGGSKGVKNKNLRDLLGKPLLAYTLLQAKATGLFDAVAVSSDSPEILETAKKWGADHLILRPAELATDHAPKLPAIQHAAREVEKITGKSYDTFVDLDATSPLRLPKDIEESVKLLEEKKVSNVITAAPARRSPYFNLVERDENGFVRLCKPPASAVARRQDAPACFDMNASIYVWNRKTFFEKNGIFNEDTLLYEMPEERSVDIDSELDFEFVEFLMKKGNHS
jgi:N-acylneuraminate cytidylyltransferase/CMP-N,N'-diacetyllegionaminic acid synthase